MSSHTLVVLKVKPSSDEVQLGNLGNLDRRTMCHEFHDNGFEHGLILWMGQRNPYHQLIDATPW